MNFDAIILQLKSHAPIFNGNVAGAAEWADGVDNQVWLPTPAAYVIPETEEAGPNEQQNGLRQTITERFVIVIALDNRVDRRGQASARQLDIFKSAIFKSILDWRPDSTADAPDYQKDNPFVDHSSRGLRYGGGDLRGMDRARFFWGFVFELDVLITGQYDGWTPDAVPLTEIQVNPPEGSFASFDIPIPQDTAS